MAETEIGCHALSNDIILVYMYILGRGLRPLLGHSEYLKKAHTIPSLAFNTSRKSTEVKNTVLPFT